MDKEFVLRIFKNYSLGELKSMFPSHVINFIEEAFPNENLGKESMARLIISDSVLDFLIDPINREEFISRMSIGDIFEVLERLDIPFKKENDPRLYAALTSFSEKHLGLFLEALGFDWVGASVSDQYIKDIVGVSPIYSLYSYQNELSKKVLEDISLNPGGRMLIHLPTGAGKTRTALNTVCQHLRQNPDSLVIWITASNELCEQASDEFEKAWGALGSYKATCYNYFGKSSLGLGGIDKGILIASVKRLYNRMNDKNPILFNLLSKNCSLLIFDEAHQCIAPTYKKTVDAIKDLSRYTYMVGLTATPGRGGFESSEEDKKLAEYFDNRKITMRQPGYESPVQYLIDNGYLANPLFHKLKYTIPFSDRDEIDRLKEEDAIYRLSLIDDRNSAILQKVEEEYSKGKYIIVFACNMQHSINLSYALNFRGIPSVSVTSSVDSNPDVRREKIDRYKSGEVRVIVNYGILTTGFDAPKTNAAIIARPTQSLVLYSQMIGRAMRGEKSGGNKECDVYTVQDEIKQFTNANYAFMNWNGNYIETNI